MDMSRSRVRKSPAQEPQIKTRIFVGDIAYTAAATDIRNLFSPFGEVAAAHVFTAAGTKRFAFVLMTNESDAEAPLKRSMAQSCARES